MQLKEEKRKLSINLFKRLLSIRRTLKDEMRSDNVLSKDIVSDLEDFEDFISEKVFVDINPFKSSDYLLIIDFRDKLYSRNSYIEKGQIDVNQLKKHNQDCLNLVEQILTSIDWLKIAHSEQTTK